MKRHNIFFLLLLCLSLTLTTSAQNIRDNELSARQDSAVVDSIVPEWPQNLQTKLNKLLEDKLLEVSLAGIMVYDLTADSIIFSHNERQLMRPASTMKMITAVTALDRLGGSHLFKTKLAYTGKLDNRTLDGNLYLIGGFDPQFSNEDLSAFVQRIKEMGIDTITGKLIADKSMKDDKPMGEGWCWDDDDSNPLMSPLQINKKDDVIGRFRRELIREGVHIVGFTEEGRAPRNAQEICVRSHTMDQILLPMMKNSDNLYAEAMFYQMGATTGAHPANAKSAAGVVKKLITKLGLKTDDYRIADGSGLSLYNYVTPELEMKFLKYAYENRHIYDHLYPSMPIAGEDGTLKKRMQGTPAAGNVHAKTGTVTGVSCLAGYCTAANGHLLCFSIMNNGLTAASKGRNFQDRVCATMCEP